MRTLTFLVLFHFFPLFAWCDSIAFIVPWYKLDKIEWFQFENGTPKEKFLLDPGAQRLWKNMADVLQLQGDTLTLCDIQKPGWETTLRSAKKIICFNIPLYAADWRKMFTVAGKEKFILIEYDPQMNLHYFNKQEFYNFFGKILTFEDKDVNRKNIFKFNYCTLDRPRPVVDFKLKKMFTQISSNVSSGYSPPQYELYAERLKVIRYFEHHPSESFDFYGRGWPDNEYKNYKGSVKNKIEPLRNYKFTFCYENCNNLEGYISEKIFDCFKAGSIPIYWGAPDIEKHIPPVCYIDRRRFSSMDELVAYLKNMPLDDYQAKIDAIHSFLESKQAQQFSDEAFKKTFTHVVYGT